MFFQVTECHAYIHDDDDDGFQVHKKMSKNVNLSTFIYDQAAFSQRPLIAVCMFIYFNLCMRAWIELSKN